MRSATIMRRRNCGGAGKRKIIIGWYAAAAVIMLAAESGLCQQIATDKTSYKSGETVVITGEGWQPQEQVSLIIGSTSGSRSPVTVTATAGATGAFRNQEFLTQSTDRGELFTVTARGTSGADAILAFRGGTAPGSLRCSGASRFDDWHYGLVPGQKVACTIEAASDLSVAQRSGTAPVEVLVRSPLLGDQLATVTGISGDSITFEYTAPVGSAGSATVSYGPITACDSTSRRCATFPTHGNDANSYLMSWAYSAAGFVYLADAAAASAVPNISIATSPAYAAFSNGSPLSYRIVVSNPAAQGSLPATNVTLTDELPVAEGLGWLSVTSTQGDCALFGNLLSCTLGDIAPQAAVTVNVASSAATSAGVCQYLANRPVATADGGIEVAAAGALTCTPLPQLSVAYSSQSGSFLQGAPLALDITVTNPAPPVAGLARNVILNEQLPGNGGLTWYYGSASQGDCTLQNNYLSCLLGSIAPGATVTVTAKTASQTPALACQALEATAMATADGGASAKDVASLSCTPPLPAQLAVVESPHVGTFSQGGPASFTIVVSNPAPAGAAAATNVTLRDQLPINGGLTWSQASATQGICVLTGIASNYLSCSLGSIPAGASVTVIVSTPATTSPVACTSQSKPPAVVTADGGLTAQDGGSLGCTPSLPTTLAVEKTPDEGSFAAGDSFVFTYTVRNTSSLGAAPATNVQLIDPLPGPGGLLWSTASEAGTCSVVNNVLTCSLGTIPTGGAVKVAAYLVRVPAAACSALVSTARVTADGGASSQDSGSATCIPASGTESGGTGNGGSAVQGDTVTACAGPSCLTLVKSASNRTPKPGEAVLYSYQVTNTSAVSIDNITVTDDNGTPNDPSDDITVGTIATLAPHASTTLTKSIIPSDSSIVARLASAGPGNFAILSLGGDAAHPGSGINCSNATVDGNMVIAGYGKLTNAAPCVEKGKLIKGSKVTYSGPGKLLGGATTDESYVESARADAMKAAAYFAAMPVTESAQSQFPANGNISGDLTVTGKAGFNVVSLTGLRLTGNLKLTGPPGAQFVLNISGNFDLHSGRITTAGGVGPYDVVYNITNPGATVKTMVPTIASGILLAPYNAISPMDSATFYGQIIGGYNKVITLMSATKVVSPGAAPQPYVTNTATASNGTVSVSASVTVIITSTPEPPSDDEWDASS